MSDRQPSPGDDLHRRDRLHPGGSFRPYELPDLAPASRRAARKVTARAGDDRPRPRVDGVAGRVPQARTATWSGGIPLPGLGSPPPPSRRVPILLRASLAVAVLLAIAASALRAGSWGDAGGAVTGLASSLAGSPVASSARRVVAGSAGSTAPVRGCRVAYAVTSRSDDRATAVLTIVNTGRVAVDGWTLRWRPPAGAGLTNGWNATVMSGPDGASASDAGIDRRIPPGGSATIGFVVVAKDPGRTPSAFSLNGVRCR